MVQLELDPVFMQPERSFEIAFARSQILRTRIQNRWGVKYKEISFDSVLSNLYKLAFNTYKRNPYFEKTDPDWQASEALKEALPYLQGASGQFTSISHFKHFYRILLKNATIDQYRHKSTSSKHREEDKSLTIEVKKPNREGFQPILLRIKDTHRKREQAMEALLEELKNPVISRSEFLQKSRGYRQRALQLLSENPQFNSVDIVNILQLEGYRKFSKSSIRVWFLRYRKDQQLSGV